MDMKCYICQYDAIYEGKLCRYCTEVIYWKYIFLLPYTNEEVLKQSLKLRNDNPEWIFQV